jgi:glycosyltransferase involved in cell wall biosynthesis
MKTITCIIPARNEQGRIQGVLAPAIDSQVFNSIIVVNDASDDYTGVLARDYGAIVLTIPYRVGKSKAVAKGLGLYNTYGSSNYTCLLDADLTGLTPWDLKQLAAPIFNGSADASLSRRGKGSGMWPGLDILTGERILPTQLLLDCHLERRASMEMETVINESLIRNNSRIAVVEWPNVANPSKRAKYGFLSGVKEDFRMYRDVFRTGIRPIARQTRQLNRQII